MVNYYQWSHMSSYAGLVEVDNSENILSRFHRSPMGHKEVPDLAHWNPIQLVIFEGEKGYKRKTKGLGDFISAGAANILSSRAVDCLSDIWEIYGDLYPVNVEEESDPYYIFHPKNVLDCLDRNRSNYETTQAGLISIVLDFVFLDNVVGDSLVFTIKELPDLPIYVSEVFKERVKKSKLRGLELNSKFFDLKPWKSG